MTDFLGTKDERIPANVDAATAVRYPANLCQAPYEKWMLFEIRSSRHLTRTGMAPEFADQKDTTLKSVALYLPPDALNSSLNVTWQQDDYGAMSGAAIERALQTNTVAHPTSMLTSGGLIPKLLGDLGATVADVLATDLVVGARKIGEGFVGETRAAGVTGTTVNPRTDLFFKSVEYRTHSFNFQMVPRSLEEARAIDDILNTFQFYMLPSFGGETGADAAFIGYPYEFVITMFTQATDSGSSHHINSIDRSVLESCTINHASAGSRVAFVNQVGSKEYYPASTNLSLQFKEVRLQGRNQQTKIWRGQNSRWSQVNYPDPRSGAGIEQEISNHIKSAASAVASGIGIF